MVVSTKKVDSEGPALTGKIFASTVLNDHINDVYGDNNPNKAAMEDIRRTRYAIRTGYEGLTHEEGEARAGQIIELFKERHQKGKPYQPSR